MPTRTPFLLPILAIVSVIGIAAARQPERLTINQPPADGSAFVAHAEQAAAERNFAAADEAFRRALDDPSTRPRAAAGLRALHKSPGFKLPIDRDRISAMLKRLGPNFARRDTPHFVILSDCELRWTQARGDVLERTWAQFYRVADRMGLDAYPPRDRLLCILFDRREDFLAFATAQDGFKSPWAAGYYSTAGNHIAFYNDASSPDQSRAREHLSLARQQSAQAREQAAEATRDGRDEVAQRFLAAAEQLDIRIRDEEKRLAGVSASASTTKTIHEAIHLLAFNSGVQSRNREYPFWISEGLAAAFETDRPLSAFGPDRGASSARLDDFRRLHTEGRLPPLPKLIPLMDAGQAEGAAIEAMYTQSHALFAHLYSQDAKRLGRYLHALTHDTEGLDPLRLFTEHFGDPAAVEADMFRSFSDRRRPAPR